MIVAIYARKSTEQAVTGEERSIARQIEHARAYARKKGWTVAEEHVYADDGISGAEFVKRAGFLRLMNALKPRPSFQGLIMSEESRLGREQIETAYALKQITDAGVRVFFYLADRERTLDTALDKVMLSLSNFAAEMEREKASQRTHDALVRKARALHVTGGRVYGYNNIEVLAERVDAEGQRRRQCVIRRINPEEALVVRRIFELYAAGLGLTRVAKALNIEHLPPPGRHAHGWAPTAVREILHRELYRGVLVWNRTQKIQRAGTKKQRKRPEAEWVRVDAPELRIVAEDLWQAVKAGLARAREMLVRANADGRLLGRRPGGDPESPYLLSGLAKCAVCGGSLVAMTRGHGKRRAKFYGCAYYHKRGATVCSNNIQIRQERLDRALLEALSEALDERIIEQAVEKALARLRSGQERMSDRLTALERELSLVEARIRHLVEAVTRGKGTDSLLDTLQAEEDRKKVVRRELAALADLPKVVSLDAKRVVQDLRARVADVRGLLGRHIPQARQMLRKLIQGRLVCEPFDGYGRRGYRFTATGTYGGLFAGAECVNDGRIPLGPPNCFCWCFMLPCLRTVGHVT